MTLPASALPLKRRRHFSAYRIRRPQNCGATGSMRAAPRARWRSRSVISWPEMLARVLAGRDVEIDAVEDFSIRPSAN